MEKCSMDGNTNNGISTEDMQSVTVWRQFFCEVKVEDDILRYWFNTLGHDIGFGFTFTAQDSCNSWVMKDCERVPSHIGFVQGQIAVPSAGVISLQWDNKYSWITEKELQYKYEIVKNIEYSSNAPNSVDIIDTFISDQANRGIVAQTNNHMEGGSKTKRPSTLIMVKDLVSVAPLKVDHDKVRPL
jgi:hypothetical protein